MSAKRKLQPAEPAGLETESEACNTHAGRLRDKYQSTLDTDDNQREEIRADVRARIGRRQS
jgi:hypothetical protein